MGSHRYLRFVCAALCALTVAGCGGSGSSGEAGFGGGGGGGGGGGSASASAVSISLPGGNQLPADADSVDEGLPVVALAVDRNNNAVPGVLVTFAATSGELAVINATTDDNGRASATLTTASNSQLRDITLLASAGGAQTTAVVSVVAPSRDNEPDPRLGLIQPDGGFMAGVIGVAVSPLASGGSSGLRIDVVDVANGNALFTDPLDVTFSSSCISSSLASVTPNPTASANGAVSATYVAQGCSGEDVVTARVVVDGVARTAQGSIQVLPSVLGAIEFVSAEPINIGLRGAGRAETSTVRFRVRNSAGGPVADQQVTFSLNTTLGGITLDPPDGRTNTDGIVQTVVRSGTVATAVRVTARAAQDGNTVSSQSEQLTITTGIPDQDSFSLSVECANVEGFDIDGTTEGVTLRGADRYNNPVPDGTAVNLTTEGGSINGSCVTLDGACSVTWTSQDPRPIAYNNCPPGDNDDGRCSERGSAGGSRAGRSTVLAFAVGEESFIDADSDGLYDTDPVPGEGFDDRPEAWLDVDGDGTRDAQSPVEPFFDFNSDGQYNDGDGQFNGLLCDNNDPSNILCSLPRTIHVRDTVTIIMSRSSPEIDFSAFEMGGDVFVSPAGIYDPEAGRITIAANQTFVLRVVIRDSNEQPMPAETEIAFSASGDGGAIQGTSTFAVPCTTDDTVNGNDYGIAFKGADLDAGDPNGNSNLELSVTTPSGLNTLFSLEVVTEAPGSD